MYVSRHHLPFYQISARLDFKYGRQVAILEKNQSAITPELMAGSAPNFHQVYLISMHDIVARILI
jgi:hypothetical protein